jgi:beta-lactam-binding protein with PASTA domain
MPDLIGKNAAKVMDQLKALDFKIGDFRHTYYPGLGKGIIIKQFPPDGYRIQKRNLITLEVSR